MIAHPETLLDQLCDVSPRPGADAVPLRIGTLQDQRPHGSRPPHGGELAIGQPRSPVFWRIRQPRQAFRVVANDRINHWWR